MEDAFYSAIDDLDEQNLEKAVFDFLTERRLTAEFLIWLDKWKSIRTKMKGCE